MSTNEIRFGDYIKLLRMRMGKTLRETAVAIGVSPQFYSEVEKNRRCAFTVDRLRKLEAFLRMSPDEAREMNNKAAETFKGKNVAVPQDFADYVVQHEYVMSALRKMKELNADEEDWEKMVKDFEEKKRKSHD